MSGRIRPASLGVKGELSVRRITRPGDAITTDRALALQPTIPQIRRNSTTVRMPCFFALRIIAFNVTSPTGVRSPSKTAKNTFA